MKIVRKGTLRMLNALEDVAPEGFTVYEHGPHSEMGEEWLTWTFATSDQPGARARDVSIRYDLLADEALHEMVENAARRACRLLVRRGAA